MEIKPDLGQSLQLQALAQLGDLSRQIGVVEGQNNIIISEQQRAEESRKAIHAKLSVVDSIKATVDRIAPLVDAHEKTAQQAAGALVIGRVLWGVLAGAVGSGLTIILGWLSGMRPPPPH